MSQKWRTMLGVSLGAFCPPIGISTISIGLPVIAAALHQPITSAEWVIVTYVLVITSLLMTFGRLGDLISTKRLYVLGFTVFTLGALASGLSHIAPAEVQRMGPCRRNCQGAQRPHQGRKISWLGASGLKATAGFS